jgi:hypothetical protein
MRCAPLLETVNQLLVALPGTSQLEGYKLKRIGEQTPYNEARRIQSFGCAIWET